MLRTFVTSSLIMIAGGAALSALAPGVLSPPAAAKPMDEGLRLDAADRDALLALASGVRGERARTLIDANWDEAWIPASLEILTYIPDAEVRRSLVSRIALATGQNHGTESNAWLRWLWNEPAPQVAGYGDFMAEFYREIDPAFGRYFAGRDAQTRIRFDEIRWGGVRQDGIPPLRQPKMLKAADADYLDDADVVFGIEIDGDVRAYPKRILAWHEMFVDEVGGVDVAGVYCTLCGTVILYETDGHDLGTSGFLYRSNKLMYDRATQSLWNTLTGEPVVGPLVDRGIKLDHRSVVTTTWGKWRELHPDTQVLSLETGHRRDYREGVAYHDYFATDDRMFETPFSDTRLANKQEVLALRLPGARGRPLAISADYLAERPVHHGEQGGVGFVVLTDETGANRVYAPGDVRFASFDGARRAVDESGTAWRVEEARLTAPDGRTLERLPYHRAFWFGWQAAYPATELVK